MNVYLKSSLVLLILLFSTTKAEIVCSVHDGDTVRIAKTNCTPKRNTHSIRLWGIDAPELGQPLAKESRNYLKNLTEGRKVRIVECAGKSFKRKVCRIQISDSNGPAEWLDVGVLMVRAGFAYDYPEFSKMAYHRPQAEAQSARVGVWRLPDGGVRPWQYRKQKHGN